MCQSNISGSALITCGFDASCLYVYINAYSKVILLQRGNHQRKLGYHTGEGCGSYLPDNYTLSPLLQSKQWPRLLNDWSYLRSDWD